MHRLNAGAKSKEAPLKKSQDKRELAFSQLTRGDHFGARVLIPFEHYQSMKLLSDGKDAFNRYYPYGITDKEK